MLNHPLSTDLFGQKIQTNNPLLTDSFGIYGSNDFYFWNGLFSLNFSEQKVCSFFILIPWNQNQKFLHYSIWLIKVWGLQQFLPYNMHPYFFFSVNITKSTLVTMAQNALSKLTKDSKCKKLYGFSGEQPAQPKSTDYRLFFFVKN